MLKQLRGPSTSTAAIVNHPLRLRCWLALSETPTSPTELARQLHASVGDTTYHVKQLCEMGIAEKVDERPVRGVIETFYRAVRNELTQEQLESMSDEESISHATAVTQLAFADVALALDTGKLAERKDHAVVRFPMVLDEDGWDEISAAYGDLLDILYKAQAKSVERMSTDPLRKPIAATALAYLFEKPARTD
jgi:predicted transcriptional regulator